MNILFQNMATSNQSQAFSDYFNMTESSAIPNSTESSDVVPIPEQEFVISVYSALLVIGALGNVAVFTSLMRSRRRKSRVNLLMTHLAVADMIVIFFVIPLEVRISDFKLTINKGNV